jgi:hypothetical protein
MKIGFDFVYISYKFITRPYANKVKSSDLCLKYLYVFYIFSESGIFAFLLQKYL